MKDGLYFWKYKGNTRNYGGYHLSLDEISAAKIIERINSRIEMKMSRPITLSLSKPNDCILSVPNNRNHKAYSKPKLKVSIDFDAQSNWLNIEETFEAIHVVVSTDIATELIDNISNLVHGENDYAMHGNGKKGEEHCIWFW